MKRATPSTALQRLGFAVLRRVARLIVLVRDEVLRQELDLDDLYLCPTCRYTHRKGSPCPRKTA